MSETGGALARRTRWRRLTRGAFLFAALALGCLRCESGLREDELECERTAIHLKGCCPSMRESAIDCEYVAPSDCGEGSLPDLNVEDAQCLRGLSCPDIVASGLCASLTSSTTGSGSSGSGGSSSSSSSSGGRITNRTVCK